MYGYNWFLDFHNWILNSHNWIPNIQNSQAGISMTELWISITELWLSMIQSWMSIITLVVNMGEQLWKSRLGLWVVIKREYASKFFKLWRHVLRVHEYWYKLELGIIFFDAVRSFKFVLKCKMLYHVVLFFPAFLLLWNNSVSEKLRCFRE